ncbi:MAG: GTPase Era [Bacteroidota bacterium]|jgi:GTP-binding protein Era
MAHKAGFVNILGNPNVGKSTLLNALMGEKISSVTRKAQTTRHRIMGIMTGDDYQIVYSDTPGLLKPHYRLHKAMMNAALGAIEDADVILYLVEAGEKNPDLEVINKINESQVPVLLLFNKVDTAAEGVMEETKALWFPLFTKAEALPLSALHGLNVRLVFDKILETLPEHEPYYPDDQISDKPERFFVAEMIRERILLQYKDEVPYSVELEVTSFKEDVDITRIEVTIYVARESQKAIILGNKGTAIKNLGIESRKLIERFLETHVFLGLTVKVSKDWRDSEQALKQFGYES